MAKRKKAVKDEAVTSSLNPALQLALDAIQKQHGTGAVMQGAGQVQNVERFSSGCMSLNNILGGGWPRGRVVEIYGPESSGKTTLTLHALAEEQRNGKTVAFIDAEHAFDPEYATALGVDMDKLLISQPDNGEQALAIVEALVSSGAVSTIVVDSVAALTPRKEIEGEMGDSHMGLQARLMSQALRKLTGITSKTKTTIFFINQIRMKIGVMFGNPETTSGGNALKFYSSVRVDVRRIGSIKDGDKIVANRTRAKTQKNKTASPFQITEFDIRYGQGIDVVSDIIDLAVEANVIKKAGAWFSYEGLQIGQGKEKTRNFLKENSEVYEEIISKVKNNGPEVTEKTE